MAVRLAAPPDAIAAAAAVGAVSVREAAREIGCDPSTVRKLIRKRRLQAHHAGTGTKRKSWRVSRASIEDYIVHNAATGDAESPPSRRTRGDGVRHREAIAALTRLGLRF